MRRIVGFVAIGLGVALLLLAILLPTVAYPQLARVSADYPNAKDTATTKPVPAGTQISEGTGMEVFVGRKDPNGKAVTRVETMDVRSTRTTKGVAAAARGDDVYWETRVETAPTGVAAQELGNQPFKVTVEGVCFDRTTGVAATGCGKQGYYQPGADPATLTAPARQGQFFKFPFHTQQKPYLFWDSMLGKATPAEYVGTETIKGLQVDKFVQTIPDQVVGKQNPVPGEAFGAPPGPVTADVRYANVRTLWVEPETGVIIRGQEQQNVRLAYNDVQIPALVGTIGYTDQTVQSLVDAQKDNARSLGFIRGVAPLLAGILGLVLLAVGVVLLVRELRRESSTDERGRPPETSGARHLDLRGAEQRTQTL